jgi:putative flippase GtrA
MKTYLPDKNKFLKFLVVSILVTSVDYLIFFTFYRLTGILGAHVISYIIAILLSFILQKRFVFQSNKSSGIAFSGVIIFSLIGIALSYAVLFAYNWLFRNIVVAKILMTATMFFYNLISKKIAFGDNR